MPDKLPQADAGFIIDVSKKSYTIIDNWLFESDTLSAHEKIVYIILKRFAFEPTRIFPAHRTIARAASLSVKTIKRAIEGLTKKNLIHVRSQKNIGRSNIYLLCDLTQAEHLHQTVPLKLITESGSDSPRGVGLTDLGVGLTDLGGRSDRPTTISTSINKITKKISDNDFMNNLRANPAFKGIDFSEQFALMDAWLLKNKGRRKTRRFIENWLSRVEREDEIVTNISIPKEENKNDMLKIMREYNAQQS